MTARAAVEVVRPRLMSQTPGRRSSAARGKQIRPRYSPNRGAVGTSAAGTHPRCHLAMRPPTPGPAGCSGGLGLGPSVRLLGSDRPPGPLFVPTGAPWPKALADQDLGSILPGHWAWWLFPCSAPPPHQAGCSRSVGKRSCSSGGLTILVHIPVGDSPSRRRFGAACASSTPFRVFCCRPQPQPAQARRRSAPPPPGLGVPEDRQPRLWAASQWTPGSWGCRAWASGG